jgi:PST family polysaccharide transporter
MGFIIVAKGEQTIFFATELAWSIVSVGLAWLLVGPFGASGAGIAFFGSYVFHGLMLYPIVRKLSGFRWSAANRSTGALFLVMIAAVFGALVQLPAPWATAFGLLLAALSAAYSINALLVLVPEARLPRTLQALLSRFRRH